MSSHRRAPGGRRLNVAGPVLVAALSAVVVGPAHGARAPLPTGVKLPNLQAQLPFGESSYIDLVSIPGRVLYRFDSAIHNAGPGAFEVYYDRPARRVWQILYRRSGVSSRPLCRRPPARIPAGGCVNASQVPGDRNIAGRISMTAKGARMTWAGDDHQHWHVQDVARYSLLSPSGQTLRITKTGFCMYDLLGKGKGFYSGFNWPGNDWCQHKAGTAAKVVRMGISPRFSDHYARDLERQWVDVTGQSPGVYRLSAVVDPRNIVAETNERDQRLTQIRRIPGLVAKNVGPVPIPVNGSLGFSFPPVRIVAPNVPVKANPAGPEVRTLEQIEAGLVFELVGPPGHGSAVFTGRAVTYTPTPGYVGPDAFTYRVLDPRGLASAPATVTIAVA